MTKLTGLIVWVPVTLGIRFGELLLLAFQGSPTGAKLDEGIFALEILAETAIGEGLFEFFRELKRLEDPVIF